MPKTESALKKENKDRHHAKLETEIRERLANVKAHLTTGLEEAWNCGAKLTEYRSKVPHGRWITFLEETGLPVRTAQRWMVLSQTPLEVALSEGSISRVLSLSSPKSAPVKNQIRHVSHLSTNGHSTEETADDETAALRAELDRLKDTNIELQERLGLLESPHEEAIASLQKQLDVLKKQTATWQAKYKEEQKKAAGLRKRLKNLETKEGRE